MLGVARRQLDERERLVRDERVHRSFDDPVAACRFGEGPRDVALVHLVKYDATPSTGVLISGGQSSAADAARLAKAFIVAVGHRGEGVPGDEPHRELAPRRDRS